MPSHDEYIKQAIYTIVRNFQELQQDFEVSGQKKSKLKIVDKRSTEEQKKEFYERFKFVDWIRTDECMDGFCDKAVELLFKV